MASLSPTISQIFPVWDIFACNNLCMMMSVPSLSESEQCEIEVFLRSHLYHGVASNKSWKLPHIYPIKPKVNVLDRTSN